MTVYIPDLVADPAVRRPTIVIAPGGGYTHLSTRESEPIALTFAAMGMNAVVVRYRVAPAVFPRADAGYRQRRRRHPPKRR